MRLALCYSTKNQFELTEQTIGRVFPHGDLFWCDASDEDTEAHRFFERQRLQAYRSERLFGGADAAIVWKLSRALAHPRHYTHIGLIENDVLLDFDWFEPTIALFDRAEADGLEAGAVSARSYADRVLIQRDGYALMHNLGAGMVIFTRRAAAIVLDTFRTHWAPHVRSTWMRLCGIDIGRFWAFRGNDQWVTSDWGYDAILSAHGLASLALTPAKCQMIGQNPPLAQQGLHLCGLPDPEGSFPPDIHLPRYDPSAFELFAERTRQIRTSSFDSHAPVLDYDPCMNGERMVFAHQGPRFGVRHTGNWRLQWQQGFGPFAYRSGEGGASLSAPCYGSISFLVSGGASGARCRVRDAISGYVSERDLPPVDQTGIAAFVIPGAVTYRDVHLELSEGGVYHGYSSPEDQPSDPSFLFDHTQLPGV